MKILLPLFLYLCSSLFSIVAQAAEYPHSGVAIMYHRFGENDYPATNIRLEQLDAHIEELTSGKYNVMRLEDMIKSLQAGDALLDRSVAITIDDAFLSVFEEGWPRFKKANLPVTLFLSAGPLDEKLSDYMSWDQLNQMIEEGLDVAGHSKFHSHLPALDPKRSLYEIQSDYDIITDKTGKAPILFAYPYGEASSTVIEQVKETGYIAAFGQHSGAMTAAHDQFYLPRFPVNEQYGEPARFKMSLNAVGLAATDFLPKNPFLKKDDPHNPPAIGFTLPRDLKNSSNLACYHSKEGKVENMELIGRYRVELRFENRFTPGRTRVNCTLPAGDGRWYWYGMQFYVK